MTDVDADTQLVSAERPPTPDAPPARRSRRWGRRIAVGAVVGAGLAAAGVWLARPRLERAIEQRLVAEAQQRGCVARVERVRLGLLPPLTLEGLSFTRPGKARFATDRLSVGLAPWGHSLRGPALRLRSRRAWVALAGGVAIQIEPASWDVRRTRLGWALRRHQRNEILAAEAEAVDGETRWQVRAGNVDLATLMQVYWRRTPLIGGGLTDAEVRVVRGASGAYHITASGTTRGLRLYSIQALELNGETGDRGAAAEPELGTPTDATLALAAQIAPRTGGIEIGRLRVTSGEATVWLGGSVVGGATDPIVDMQCGVERLDFATTLRTAGLELPANARRLGSAALELAVKGRVRDPAGLVVTQRLEYEPPAEVLPAVSRLSAPFLLHVRGSYGRGRQVLLSPESPDFIALEDVPPRFLRALLLAEDSNFYGHRGIDLAEVPVAMATNWIRGRAARGASTITQQLVKNVFLSREKSFSRKLQELALSLMVDERLSKQRILEIYLNVIEWGPDVYGLRPAAQHYFQLEPEELSTKEIVFLVCMIPGPIKYQRSIAGGTPSPAFERLMANLLAKLLAVGEIDEDEYQGAIEEVLTFGDHDQADEAGDGAAPDEIPGDGGEETQEDDMPPVAPPEA